MTTEPKRDAGIRAVTGFEMFKSVTVRYSTDDMRADIWYNGRPTPLYGLRDDYEDPFRLYVEHRPDSPIFTETKGWGLVGGISMILEALVTEARHE